MQISRSSRLRFPQNTVRGGLFASSELNIELKWLSRMIRYSCIIDRPKELPISFSGILEVYQSLTRAIGREPATMTLILLEMARVQISLPSPTKNHDFGRLPINSI